MSVVDLCSFASMVRAECFPVVPSEASHADGLLAVGLFSVGFAGLSDACLDCRQVAPCGARYLVYMYYT